MDGLCEDIGPIFSTVTVLLDNTILYSLLRMEPAKLDALFAFWTACLRKDLPDLAAHFDELGLGPPMYVVDWLFTCYCKVLSPDVAVWVWDRLILHPDGDLYLVKAGLGLLRTLRSRCLAGDLADCMQLLHVAHPADPGDTAAAEEIHKAIEKAKVSSSEFERFRQRLEAVEELVGSVSQRHLAHSLSAVFRPFCAALSPFFPRCPASWRQDGENGRKMAKNGRNLGEKRARNSGG